MENPIKKRLVFFVAGFRTETFQNYINVFREEAARQSDISNYLVNLKPIGSEPAAFIFQAKAEIFKQPVTTNFHVLNWGKDVDDLAPKGTLITFLLLLRIFWSYLISARAQRQFTRATHSLRPLFRASFFLLFYLLFSTVMAGAAFWVFSTFFPLIAAVPLSVMTGWFYLRLFRNIDQRFSSFSTIQNHFIAFQTLGKTPKQIRNKIIDFKELVAKKISDEVDEVLIVGHSETALHAIMLAAEIERESPTIARNGTLSLVTLGHHFEPWILLKNGDENRSALSDFCQNSAMTWYDVINKHDFAKVPLVEALQKFRVIEAAPNGYKHFEIGQANLGHQAPAVGGVSQVLRRHFYYLYAQDRPKEYDFYSLAFGPIALRERLARQD